MRSSDPRPLRLGIALALFALVAAAPAADPAAAPPPKAKKAAPKAKKGPQPEVAVNPMDNLLEVGKTISSVKVPSVDEKGHMTSLNRFDKVTRIDAETFALEGATLISFEASKEKAQPEESTEPVPPAAPPSPVMVVQFSVGTYHQGSGVLHSDEPARIVKPEFDLTGDSLTYDSKNGTGHMRGNVRMVLHEAKSDAKTSGSGKAEEKANPLPDLPPPPKATPAEPPKAPKGGPPKPSSTAKPAPR